MATVGGLCEAGARAYGTRVERVVAPRGGGTMAAICSSPPVGSYSPDAVVGSSSPDAVDRRPLGVAWRRSAGAACSAGASG